MEVNRVERKTTPTQTKQPDPQKTAENQPGNRAGNKAGDQAGFGTSRPETANDGPGAPRAQTGKAQARKDQPRKTLPPPDSPRGQQLANAQLKQDALDAAAKAPAPLREPNTRTKNRSGKNAAGPARPKRRHYRLVAFFIQLVVLPSMVAGWYLFAIANDQYASHVGFSVRNEESGSAFDLLGGITDLSGSSSNDTDVLFEFIQSQNMVEKIAARIDLQEAFSIDGDPVFSLGDDTRIEALHRYWGRMVSVFYDRSSGLIEIRVKSFDPVQSQTIARAIFEESSAMINELSDIAREDRTRYALEDLELSLERLKQARAAITAFRIRTQIVDPAADIQGRMGLLNTLQAQLAEALIEQDLLEQASNRDDDPRLVQGQRRVEVIENRIAAERARFSEGGARADDIPYSELVSQYEALSVDLSFAEESYILSLGAYNTAVAEAQRQSKYLAQYIEPTLPQTPQYPQRITLLMMVIGAFFAIWALSTMIYYSLRDRR